jgi:phycocyanobilin lyase subunit beta
MMSGIIKNANKQTNTEKLLTIDTLRQAIETAANASDLADAVQALADARQPDTVPDLIRALGYNNPGAAVAAVDGLIHIGKPAVAPLLELLDDYNYGARAWALRALAAIGDPRAFDLLLDTAQNDFALSVRRAAARGLGTMKWAEMPPAAVPTAQAQTATALDQVSRDHEWIVRYAAIAGLESLAAQIQDSAIKTQTVTALQTAAATDPETAPRARAQLALQRLQATS